MIVNGCSGEADNQDAANSNDTNPPTVQDTVPNLFSFTDQVNVSLNNTITSNTITIAGISTTASISVSGGSYDINQSGNFVSDNGVISNGNTVRVRHTSSASYSAVTTTTLTIGGVSDEFASTTSPAVPDPEANNPDALAAATQTFYSRDFDAQLNADVFASAVVSMSYQTTAGYQSSGAWLALPQPINVDQNEDNVGWAGSNPVAVDQARRVVYSYLLFISNDLMQDIVTAADTGSGNWFWNHGNKIIDVLQWNAGGDATDATNANTRYVIKVRRNGGAGSAVQFSHLNGGAGNEYYDDGVNTNPDLATMTDQWIWVAHVLDEQNRSVTTYIKRQGDAGVTRCLVRDSSVNLGTGALASNGRGFVADRGVWGYWDDIITASASATKYVALDRLRITNGWVDPPF